MKRKTRGIKGVTFDKTAASDMATSKGDESTG